MRKPAVRLLQMTQLKRERKNQKLTEEWGCESETGVAFLASTILILIVTAIASGCVKSGTCSGFWKERAHGSDTRGIRAASRASHPALRVGLFPHHQPSRVSPLHFTWTESVNRIVSESKSESETSNRSQMTLKIVNWTARMNDLDF